jgi:hypothetical protein
MSENDLLVRELAKDIREIRETVMEIRETLAERRGERRVALWAAGAMGGVLGALLAFSGHLLEGFIGRK